MLAHSKKELKSEDDVLHLTNAELPSFNGRVSPMEAEYLLQVLTAPYLRLPLLLSFFSPQHRVSALAEPSIQEMLDSVLFEPGLWHHRAGKTAPTEVPAATRDCFGTPVGLLVNELHHAPALLTKWLLELGDNVLDLDMGRYRPSGSSLAILYVLRLLVRVEGHVGLVLGGRQFNGGAGGARGVAPSEGAAAELVVLQKGCASCSGAASSW